VWFPKDEEWFNVFTRKKYVGTGRHQKVEVNLDIFGLFARAGSIIPLCQVTEKYESICMIISII
jgi:alpha-glucosidase (family GH31 glycosyl hydrolase)